MMTPLDERGQLDENSLRATTKYMIEKKVHGLVFLGSNGEFPYLAMEEKKKVIDIAAEEAHGKITIIAGTGVMGTDETILLSQYAKKAGFDGLMIPLPIYYKLHFDQVYEHLQNISDEVDLPIIYYHFPENTHLPLKPAEIARLTEIKNIIGIKESILNLREIQTHLELIKKQPFFIFSGTSYILLDVLKMGGCGVICPLPNIIPEDILSIYQSFQKGDLAKAKEDQNKIFSTLPIFSGKEVSINLTKNAMKILSRLGIALKASGGTPQAILKEAMSLIGIPIKHYVKKPLPQITPEQTELVKSTLKKMGLL